MRFEYHHITLQDTAEKNNVILDHLDSKLKENLMSLPACEVINQYKGILKGELPKENLVSYQEFLYNPTFVVSTLEDVPESFPEHIKNYLGVFYGVVIKQQNLYSIRHHNSHSGFCLTPEGLEKYGIAKDPTLLYRPYQRLIGGRNFNYMVKGPYDPSFDWDQVKEPTERFCEDMYKNSIVYLTAAFGI